jgi:hypothetical protein
MKFMSFTEYVARRDEGLLLPKRPLAKGLPKINAFPATDSHRRRLKVRPVKPPNPFAPTVKGVADIVPQRLVARLKTQ